MNATPLLGTLLAALAADKLEAVLIGNAAAAVQGATVTTLDFDFMFRDTPTNMAKLKRLAKRLDAVALRRRRSAESDEFGRHGGSRGRAKK